MIRTIKNINLFLYPDGNPPRFIGAVCRPLKRFQISVSLLIMVVMLGSHAGWSAEITHCATAADILFPTMHKERQRSQCLLGSSNCCRGDDHWKVWLIMEGLN